MSRLLKKTMRLFFLYDPYGCGARRRTAKRRLDRVTDIMESQPKDYFFTSAFESVGKQLNRAMRRGLDV